MRRRVKAGQWALFILTAQTALLWLAPPVRAQLNENCTVSVLNRTIQVNHDGTWVLPNIPANFGPVRARATCVANGMTQFGQSDFFTIPTNGSVNVPPIVLGSTTPIPNSMTITLPTTTLTQADATSHLTVTATYADGTSKNVTPAAAGTIYTISNPAQATVSADGMVTAVTSGTVVIQAVNEGTQGIISVQVLLAGASHGGIPDSWAIANGLDPNDSAMPFEDPDHDGLTNLQEFQAGTDPHNGDTDGDGLTDGQEVLLYHTNPLLFSTDGTGISDGIEVQTGTLGATFGAKLAAALSSLEVKPSNFNLAVNSSVGQASVQLTVLGHLIDGKTILDLTSTSKGTNYASSDLTICNFGAPDGNVFAGSNGSCTISVTNSGFTATALGVVGSFSPTPLSWVSIPGYANNVAVNGDYAYVAAGSAGLQIVDVSDRTKPKVVSAVPTPGNADDVQVLGYYAYVADGPSGIQIVDVTNPLLPVLVGGYKTPGEAWNLSVSEGIAYVADGTAGLQVINVSNPAAPVGMRALPLPGTIKALDIDPLRKLVAAVGDTGLFTISLANPIAPALVGSLNYGGSPQDITLKGNFAFVADSSISLVSVDITNPAAPVFGKSGDVNLAGELYDVIVEGNLALGAAINFVNTGVTITDISNPPALQPRSILYFPPGDARGFRAFDKGTGLAADGANLYLTTDFTNGTGQRNKNGVTGDTRLYIGQYMPSQDANGIPPTASITAPAAGATVARGGQLQITVQATDDVAVKSVNILVNGQIVFTTTSAPYQFMYKIPANATTLTIGAQAIDFGGNVGTAAAVTVTAVLRAPVSFVVTPANPSIALGTTQQFTAIENYDRRRFRQHSVLSAARQR